MGDLAGSFIYGLLRSPSERTGLNRRFGDCEFSDTTEAMRTEATPYGEYEVETNED